HLQPPQATDQNGYPEAGVDKPGSTQLNGAPPGPARPLCGDTRPGSSGGVAVTATPSPGGDSAAVAIVRHPRQSVKKIPVFAGVNTGSPPRNSRGSPLGKPLPGVCAGAAGWWRRCGGEMNGK